VFTRVLSQFSDIIYKYQPGQHYTPYIRSKVTIEQQEKEG